MTPLIWPGIYNLAAALLAPLLLEGFLIKFVLARAQSRRGASLFQPFFDQIKLLSREDHIPGISSARNLVPAASLAAVGLSALAVPMGLGLPLKDGADLAFLFSLFLMVPIARSLERIFSSSGQTENSIPGFFTTFLLEETTFFLALFTVAVRAHSLQIFRIVPWVGTNGFSLSAGVASLAAFLALQIQLARFFRGDPEQEAHLASLSGPRLAIFRWLFPAMKFIQASLFVQVFFPWPLLTSSVGNMAFHLLKVLAVFIPASFLASFRPSLRRETEQTIFKVLILCAAAALALALKGG
ncbi:MAG: NADH-quinone oxidoreductase subunit H [bacterium]